MLLSRVSVQTIGITQIAVVILSKFPMGMSPIFPPINDTFREFSVDLFILVCTKTCIFRFYVLLGYIHFGILPAGVDFDPGIQICNQYSYVFWLWLRVVFADSFFSLFGFDGVGCWLLYF